jgi:putative copper resistance protein D
MMDGTPFVAARLAVYAALMLAAGVPLALTFARERGGWKLAAGSALVAMAASLWWVLESVASMAALPLTELDADMVRAVIGATPLGGVIAIRLTALTAALLALWFRRLVPAAIASSIALSTLAWTGHAGASEAGLGLLHCASDILHLLAAATWLGALVLFLGSAFGSGEEDALAHRLAKFAGTGSAIVAVLLATGIANTLIISGGRIDLGNPWFGLLAAKLALFAGMLGLAAGNRWRLAPALAEGREGGLRAIRLSLIVETGLACLILAVVSVLGTLSPN